MDHKNSIKIDNESINVDPELLFMRLIQTAALNPEQFDMNNILKFELCCHPPSLFEKSGLMREHQKHTLADLIVKEASGLPDASNAEFQEIVIDGGFLIHKIPWTKGATYLQIADSYLVHIKSKYPNKSITVVFDGYSLGPSTKDSAHLRRSGGVQCSKVNAFRGDLTLSAKKNVFLTNRENKQAFIMLLASVLSGGGVSVIHAQGDADVLIAKTGLAKAAEANTVVVGNDTDILILLLFHARHKNQGNCKDIILKADKASNCKHRTWPILWLVQKLKAPTCMYLPVLQAFTGCDTTSRLFGIGKSQLMKKIPDIQDDIEVFYLKDQSQEHVVCAGERILLSLYNARLGEDDLDTLRVNRWNEKVYKFKMKADKIQSLPPTSASAKYHSLRVYLQVQVKKIFFIQIMKF